MNSQDWNELKMDDMRSDAEYSDKLDKEHKEVTRIKQGQIDLINKSLQI